MAREEDLSDAFVDLADTLVSDFDVSDLLHSLAEHCVALLEVAAVGILLNDQRGNLQLLASSSEQTRLLELFQLQADEGPCLEAFRTGQIVAVSDVEDEIARWPAFAPAAVVAGYRGVHALPLRLRSDTIGALNLFTESPGALPEKDLNIGRALGHVATIGILQERVIARSGVLIEQLQGAVGSRVIIEQAKGVIAAAAKIGPDEAFQRLRQYARVTPSSRLVDISRDIINGALPIDALLRVDKPRPADRS